jgi:UDP-N-acetylglucosamine acyltransferase
MSIHPTAIVDPSAEIGDGVEIGPFTIVEAGARIGEGCRIGPHGVIGAGAVLGKNNTTFSGAQIGVAPQDLKHVRGAAGTTIIGDNNTIREFVTISSSTVYAGDLKKKETRIGSGCLFMANSHVGHDCHVGDGVILANSAALSGHVTVHDRAILGGLTGVHQFCTIGKLAFVGGMARVNKDVLPYMITEGHPARCFGPNQIGLQRNGLDASAIARIRRIYKLLYRSGLNTKQAVEAIRAEVEESPERATLLDFIEKSARGITK